MDTNKEKPVNDASGEMKKTTIGNNCTVDEDSCNLAFCTT
jgi:hypothetical protein